MLSHLNRRFWKEVTVQASEAGYSVLLDSRRVMTPAKAALILPTQKLAEVVAEEWRVQGEEIDPATMPFTRSANAAIDKVATNIAGVVTEIAGYGASDLLCYRAEFPDVLRDRQAEAWDPLLGWLRNTHRVRLITTTGVMHVAQDAAALETLSGLVAGRNAWQLTALHDLVSLSGSLVIGLAVTEAHLSAKTAWPISRIDELWQIEQWGEDAEAAEAADLKFEQFSHAERFYSLAYST